jgi:hypothetical protein
MIPIESDQVVSVVIPYFLRLLMKIERERLGMAQRDASLEVGWPPSVWGAIERGTRPLEKDQWIAMAEVLHVGPAETVKRLNGFIGKYPSIWLEKIGTTGLAICERPVTSPRIIRSGKVVNVDLNPIRPNLYHELSAYCSDPVELIAFAVDLDYYGAQKASLPPQDRARRSTIAEDRREQVLRFIRELSPEKFGLLERIIDKFERYPSQDLAKAYEHFSLSIRKR